MSEDKKLAVETVQTNTISKSRRKLIRETVAQGVSDTGLELLFDQAERTGLDPLARQIYVTERRDYSGSLRPSVECTIDGFRLVAERHGKYAGQMGPFWCNDDGEWRDVWVSSNPPAAAKIGVLRHDFSEPCWGVARFAAYAQKKKGGGLNHAWSNMGDVMIAKCAEALALRKAFPRELSGLYTIDEMAQAANPKIETDDEPISEEERQRLETELEELDADKAKFCKYFGIESLKDLRKSQLKKAKTQLEAKRKNKNDSA